MKRSFLFMFGLLGLVCFGQTKMDSAWTDYENTPPDKAKWSKGKTLFFKAVYSKPDLALKVVREQKEIAEQLDRTAMRAQALNFHGIYYDVTSNRDSALYMYRRALAILEGHDSLYSLRASYYNNMGLVHAARSANDSAFHYYKLALQQPGMEENLRFQLNITHNLGIVLQRQRRHAEALSYYRKALKKAKGDDALFQRAKLYHSIGEVYQYTSGMDSALFYFKKALPGIRAQNNVFRLGMVYHNLGFCFDQIGQTDSAIFCYKKSVRLKQKMGDKDRLASTANFLAEVYAITREPDSATKYINLAKENLDTNNLRRYTVHLSIHSKVLLEAGMDREAYFMMSRSKAVLDTLRQRNYRADVAEVQEELNLMMKEAEIKALEANKKLDAEKQKNLNILILGLIILIILVFVIARVLYLRTRLKHQNRLAERELEFQERAANMMIDAQEEERQRIAQDLHDDIGQQLTGIKISWANLAREKGFKTEDQPLQLALNNLANDIRTLSHTMMPKALEQLGLRSALEDLLDRFSKQTSIKTEFDFFGLSDRYAEKVEKTLYRITQEALNNIIKHSKATAVNVQLFERSQHLTLMIEDNGNGFSQSSNLGKGLFNMRSRAKVLKAEISIDSEEGQGTVIFVKVPVNG